MAVPPPTPNFERELERLALWIVRDDLDRLRRSGSPLLDDRSGLRSQFREAEEFVEARSRLVGGEPDAPGERRPGAAPDPAGAAASGTAQSAATGTGAAAPAARKENTLTDYLTDWLAKRLAAALAVILAAIDRGRGRAPSGPNPGPPQEPTPVPQAESRLLPPDQPYGLPPGVSPISGGPMSAEDDMRLRSEVGRYISQFLTENKALAEIHANGGLARVSRFYNGSGNVPAQGHPGERREWAPEQPDAFRRDSLDSRRSWSGAPDHGAGHVRWAEPVRSAEFGREAEFGRSAEFGREVEFGRGAVPMTPSSPGSSTSAFYEVSPKTTPVPAPAVPAQSGVATWAAMRSDQPASSTNPFRRGQQESTNPFRRSQSDASAPSRPAQTEASTPSQPSQQAAKSLRRTVPGRSPS
ncbi:hypothetical protein [Micromonospora yangpuensis]|uniref:Uncharacterized protein n=1 Tax=Micromonospora yangpuensis TaxID=683228 RepID=A0A1C6V3E0_9ACTN|nr:hypothetical protein [Micromonospora yangpuensis]GGM14770.1 hypothetical protein GCM10012279_36170 [Micromonospora yangpuensis]SCL60748.1 hypothetical protein GA0070617_4462 [Micromonospora yangpuensis]